MIETYLKFKCFLFAGNSPMEVVPKTENLFLPATIQTLDYYNGLECQEFISRVLSSFIGNTNNTRKGI